MSAVDFKTFISMMKEFTSLQSALQDAFLSANAKSRDWKYLTDISKKGVLDAAGLKWNYTRHGSGVRFESDRGVVDVHNQFLERNVVDAHRMNEFLTSIIDNDCINCDLYDQCRENLLKAENLGLIEKVKYHNNLWILVQKSEGGGSLRC